MSIALLDNATLTAVQRIYGKVESRSRYSVDGDIVALENLVQSILFYNRWVVIDDYRSEYTDARKQLFPFLTFINPSEIDFSQIEWASRNELEQDVIPVISGGHFSDNTFGPIFERLKLHIQCTWDISSSIYYLTLKMLGEEGTPDFERFADVTASVFSEFLDSKDTKYSAPTPKYKLYDSRGVLIDDGYHIPGAKWGAGEIGGLSRGLESFIAALSWLSYKSIYYTKISQYLTADSFLYPIRQEFQLGYLENKNVYDHNFLKDMISRLDRALSDEIDLVVNEDRGMSLNCNLPIFSAWICNKYKDPSCIIDKALEMREGDVFVQIRETLGEIRNSFEESSEKSRQLMQKVLKNARGAIQLIRNRHGIPNDSGIDTSTLAMMYNSTRALHNLPPLPAVKSKITIPAWMQALRYRTGFGLLYKNLGKEIGNLWKLGEIRQLLGSKVCVPEYASNYTPRVESPKYSHCHSQWKSPM